MPELKSDMEKAASTDGRYAIALGLFTLAKAVEFAATMQQKQSETKPQEDAR